MAAEYGDLRGPIEKMISLLKDIERHTRCTACAIPDIEGGGGGGGAAEDSIGEANTSVPAGFRSVSITKTAGEGSVIIELDSGEYILTEVGESFNDAATPGNTLHRYDISSETGEWKWHGLNTGLV